MITNYHPWYIEIDIGEEILFHKKGIGKIKPVKIKKNKKIDIGQVLKNNKKSC